MPRFITVLIGFLIFTTSSAVVLSLFGFENNRQINVNLKNLDEDFYTNRVKLFAIPTDGRGAEAFDKIDRLMWHEIRTEMLKHRNEIEALEIRATTLDLIAISLFSTSFIVIMIYSPALWVAEFRFGNEIEKFIFNSFVGMMMLAGTVIRIYAYITSKHHYDLITAKAQPVVERIGHIRLGKAIHFCYYGYQVKGSANEDHIDGHHLTHSMHLHMDKVASAATYCHSELIDVLVIIFSALSSIVHLWLFLRTNRLGKGQVELLNEIEAVENTVEPVESEDENATFDLKITQRWDAAGGDKRKLMLPNRNPKNAFYADDEDEKYNEKAESMMETLMDAEQLRELREVYLSNYYQLKKSNKKNPKS